MSTGIQVWGWIFLGLAIAMTVWSTAPKVRGLLYLASGLMLAATAGGWIVGLIMKALPWLGNLPGRLIPGFDASVLPYMAAAVGLFLVFLGLRGKKGKPQKWHGPVYFVLPALLLALGGGWAQAAQGANDVVTGVVQGQER